MGGECLFWKRCGGTQSEGSPIAQLGFCLNERQEYSMARIDIYLETNINIKERPLATSAGKNAHQDIHLSTDGTCTCVADVLFRLVC